MILAVTPGDLWSLRRKPRSQVLLYNQYLLAQPHRPFWFAVRCMVQATSRERATAIYRDRGMSAMVQAQGRSGRPEQDVMFMAAYGARGPDFPSDRDVWFRLLDQICYSAAQNYVQRVYASIPAQHSEIRELFRQLGFQAYAHRALLQLSGPDWNQGTTLAPMRSQARRDHWAIHKLYGLITPHLVQHAEVKNSRTWALSLSPGWGGLRRRAWVLGPDDDLTAYLHILSGPVAHVLTLLVRPDQRDTVVDVLRFGLAQLPDTRQVYLLLREYQQELIVPAQDLGFQPVGEQTLLVKHTVVPVRRSALLPALEPGLEPRVTAPQISVPREESYPYARSTGSEQRY